MGIPGDQMDVIAPDYFMQRAQPEDILKTHVTNTYRIPLALCRPGIMFELTKLNEKAQYASSFEVRFADLLKKTNKNPTISQLEKMIDDYIAGPRFPGYLVTVYNQLIDKIKEIADYTIDDKHQWSAIGNALFKAARERRPRWIVLTLSHAQSPQDPVNLAMLTAVLEEIKEFAKKAITDGFDIKLGIMIDEMHTYVRDPKASSTASIHDLIFAWGRSSKIWRMYMTQKQEQLPKTFQDSIDRLNMTGTFQNIISCQSVPEPGFGKLLDRLHGRSDDSPVTDKPRFYPAVKFCPPIIEVESDYSDDAEWLRAMQRKLS
jgi:hypothetical protein